MEAAYFLQQLCQSSFLTLHTSIACRGFLILVGFLEADYAKYRKRSTFLSKNMTCSQSLLFYMDVIVLMSSSASAMLYKSFAVHGVLILGQHPGTISVVSLQKMGYYLSLKNTLYSLNEATQLASVSGGGGFPVDGVILRPRSGPLDPGHPAFSQSLAPPYGFDHPDYLKTFFPLDSERPRLSAASLDGPVTSKSHDASSFDKLAHATLKERSDPLRAAHRISTDRTPTLTDGFSNGHSATVTQQDNVRPFLSLLDKETPSRHVSGQLEFYRTRKRKCKSGIYGQKSTQVYK
ncbi:hypothetical protein AgCh_009358 [Apium graveolens]